MNIWNALLIRAGLLLSFLAFSGGLAVAGPWTPQVPTATPIKYVRVIFQEKNSFDHYFATYPHAEDPPDKPSFHARPGTPGVYGLTKALRQFNPNSIAPYRLARSDESTCDNDNHYSDEQKACGGGLLDKFGENTSATGAGCPAGLAIFNNVRSKWLSRSRGSNVFPAQS